MFASSGSALLLERGDWIAISAILLAGIGVLWRTLWKQSDMSKAMRDAIEASTKAHKDVATSLTHLCDRIERSTTSAERMNTRLLDELVKKIK